MYREIVTKAVIGKGKITNDSEIVVNPSNNPSKVLGCWVINHYSVSSFEDGKVFARGRYDLHIWYGFSNDSNTEIHKQSVDYIEEFPVKMKPNEELDERNEFVIRCLKYPTCSGLSMNDEGEIIVKVAKELSLDVIGETTLRVQVTQGDDDWPNNDDIDSIDVNYLNKD